MRAVLEVWSPLLGDLCEEVWYYSSFRRAVRLARVISFDAASEMNEEAMSRGLPSDSQCLWSPSLKAVASARITRFAERVAKRHGIDVATYSPLHQWSVSQRELFWREVWDAGEVVGDPGQEPYLLRGDSFLDASWFPHATLNFAENLLRRRDARVAIRAYSEVGLTRTLTFAELSGEVAAASRALAAEGVGAGDVVAGWIPNVPEAVVGALAAAAIGAIWTSCSPDFGVDATCERFGQVAPRILFAAPGYVYGGKYFNCLPRLEQLKRALPSIKRVVLVPTPGRGEDARSAGASEPGAHGGVSSSVTFREWISGQTQARLSFQRFPFSHPLYVLYSSGTTGKPKAIVHGAGGTLLQHLKEHQLHTNLGPDDVVFYFTTCGWMMWNWLITALASEASIVLYDGSPVSPSPARLFEIAEQAEVNALGVSAGYLTALQKEDWTPSISLPHLQTLLSTGSPLAPETFDYVYRRIKRDLCLASISGGTDIISCFALGNPTLPVYRGQLQCAGLGMDVAIFNESGEAVVGAPGELVCRRPFPSAPLGFWDDTADRTKYKSSYFGRFSGTWHHGDWAEKTREQGYIIYGRSDATLNPGGVRIGTAEIYRQVQRVEAVLDAVAVEQRTASGGRIVLFVKLEEDRTLDEELVQLIKQTIRQHATPRHVPAKVVQVSDVPRTRSGKVSELAARAQLHGEPVRNRAALANPEVLPEFVCPPDV